MSTATEELQALAAVGASLGLRLARLGRLDLARALCAVLSACVEAVEADVAQRN